MSPDIRYLPYTRHSSWLLLWYGQCPWPRWVSLQYKLSYDDLLAYWLKHVGTWGGIAKTYTFKGYKDGKHVITREVGPQTKFDLEVSCNKDELINEETYDTLRVSLRYIDEHGSTCDYATKIVEIKVNGLSENKKYTEQLKKPKNIRKLSTNTVTIEVKLGDEASTEVSDVNLSFRNLGDNLVVQAASDSINKVPVILKGTDSVISGITSSSIDAYVDLKGLTEGEHKVKINVVGSDNRVIYTPKITETKVIIIKK